MKISSYSERIKEIWGSAPTPIAKQSGTNTLRLSLSQRMRLTKAIMGLQRPANMNNLNLTLADGSPITIDASGEDIAVGDTVSLEGKPAPDGEYKLHDGKVIVVTDEKIAEIRPYDMKARAIAATRHRAGLVTPRVGRTPEEQKDLAIAAARERAGLRRAG